mgnify:CR=1 FL=1
MTRADTRYLLRPLRLFVQYFPQLAAWYLLGVLGRDAAIELAAWAGHDNDVWASLIMPMAGVGCRWMAAGREVCNCKWRRAQIKRPPD